MLGGLVKWNEIDAGWDGGNWLAKLVPLAGVAELADAVDSKSTGVTPLGVRVPPPVLAGC